MNSNGNHKLSHTMKKLLIFSLIGLMALSCKKTKDITPTSPTPMAKVCQLEGFTDFEGNETKITLDAEGRIARASVNQTQGQVLTIVSSFVYETNGQLKSGSMTFSDASGRQLASQPLSFTYTDGLLTALESRCGCPQNVVGQRTTLRYNAGKQLIERTNEYPGSPDKSVTAYIYDANGNVLNQTTPSGGKTLSPFTYTYDAAKHPQQLMKGLPLNLLAGAEPWRVNVPLTIQSEFIDEKGQKQTQELKRTDLKTNAKGYATSVSISGTPGETYTLKNCD